MKNSELIISTELDGEDTEDRSEVGAEVESRLLVMGETHHGVRLDRALAELVTEFSRSYLQQMIELGGVSVNGGVVMKAAAKVKAADQVVIELRPTPQSQAFKPEPMALDIVHQDEHLMVINKPAGLVVHPAPGNWQGTLLNGLLAHDAQAMHLPRAGIVHRLDKDTSGLMMVARTRVAMEALVRMIAAREVSRQYVALAHRPWVGSGLREVHAPIGRDPRNRLRMAVVDLERTPGKSAQTDISLLANADQGCLVRCTLHTGRTHQIRVHTSALRHPCVGDLTYGADPVLAAKLGLKRQWLHAVRLGFKHPGSGEWICVESQYPADLIVALERLQEGA